MKSDLLVIRRERVKIRCNDSDPFERKRNGIGETLII